MHTQRATPVDRGTHFKFMVHDGVCGPRLFNIMICSSCCCLVYSSPRAFVFPHDIIENAYRVPAVSLFLLMFTLFMLSLIFWFFMFEYCNLHRSVIDMYVLFGSYCIVFAIVLSYMLFVWVFFCCCFVVTWMTKEGH